MARLIILTSRGTKVEKMLTLAPERYTAGFCMVPKVILWCQNIIFQNVIYFYQKNSGLKNIEFT